MEKTRCEGILGRVRLVDGKWDGWGKY